MSANALLTAPSDVVLAAPAANTAAVATITGRAGFRSVVTGVTISANAAPAAAVLFTIVDDVDGTLEEFYIPAGAFAPIAINYNHGLPSLPGSNITATLPALGAAVAGVVTLRFVTIR